MYTEFIIIYVGIGVMLLLQVVLLIVMLVLLKEMKKQKDKRNRMISAAGNYAGSGSSIVFCTNCATQYAGTERFCPKCGAAR
ncbi:MAG: hypothetical protein NC124_16040 [Clostridium sp.]|nr:hypothetical protein [Clostridium sp.]